MKKIKRKFGKWIKIKKTEMKNYSSVSSKILMFGCFFYASNLLAYMLAKCQLSRHSEGKAVKKAAFTGVLGGASP